MKDDEFNLRLCEYALEFLADTINSYQKNILESEARLERFPDHAFSDYSARSGQRVPLSEVCVETKQGIEFYTERLKVLQADYDTIANKMSEFRKRTWSAKVSSVFGDGE